jgi:hypothetical protein
MEAKKLKRDLIILLVSSFIVIVCWIGFSIYSRAVTSTIDEATTKQTAPIQPSFDTATINSLIKREKVEPLYQSVGLVTPTPQIEEEPTPNPTITEGDGLEETGAQSTAPTITDTIATGGAILP